MVALEAVAAAGKRKPQLLPRTFRKELAKLTRRYGQVFEGSLPSRTSLCVFSGRCYSPIDALACHATRTLLPPSACCGVTSGSIRRSHTLRPGLGFTPQPFRAWTVYRREKRQTRSDDSGQRYAPGKTPAGVGLLGQNNSHRRISLTRSATSFRRRRTMTIRTMATPRTTPCSTGPASTANPCLFVRHPTWPTQVVVEINPSRSLCIGLGRIVGWARPLIKVASVINGLQLGANLLDGGW